MLDPRFIYQPHPDSGRVLDAASATALGFAPLRAAREPEIIAIADHKELVAVRFSTEHNHGEDVLLHINSITDLVRDDFRDYLMRETSPGLYELVVLLDSAISFSYRFAGMASIPADSGKTRDGWLRVHSAGKVDANNPDQILNPLGRASSVLTLPNFPAHSRPSRKSEGKPKYLLVLFDGEIWEELGFNTFLHDSGQEVAVTKISSVDLQNRSKILTDLNTSRRLLEGAIQDAQNRWHVRFTPEHIIVAGQSLGGLAATRLILRHPELVKNAISQSGSFWFDGDARPRWREKSQGAKSIDSLGVVKEDAKLLPVDSRLIMQVGTEESELRKVNLELHELLQGAGERVVLQSFPGGHDYAWWRHGLLHGLDTLLGGDSK